MEGVSIVNVCLLLKSIYCMREAPRIWYDRLKKDLKSIGLHPIPSAPWLFCDDDVMVMFYVDELLLMAENEQKLSTLKYKLSNKLPANHMGMETDFL